jgi:hypothetical protein
MKLFVHTEHGGVMGTRTRIFHENGTEIEGAYCISGEPDVGGLIRVSLDLIDVEIVRVDQRPENAAQHAINALRELVAMKQEREEVSRRKQRRLCSIARDKKEVRAVAKLHEESRAREFRAWNAARAIVSKEVS